MSASDLSPDDFGAFFRAVHGVDPFPWQARLLRQVAAKGKWPDVLDLPTGAGKTAGLDIAVFHLALEASRGAARRAPLRIAFVVDRRLIVDDAFARAQRLAKMLAAESSDPAITRVAAALRRYAGDDSAPLIARRLRGGVPREDDWARTPAQPTILCSTVDQVGSRLLFRGYGISDRMKPIHAGLLGSDCLILLDEAHLSKPFRQTLAAVSKLRRPDQAPWGVALLTATPEEVEAERFELHDDDRAHPLLSRRLAATKPARLIEISGRQGVSAEDRRVDQITEQSKTILDSLKQSIPSPAVGVVLNRVARARRVFDRLRSELAEADVTLIIGPSRGVDRESRAKELAPIRTPSDPDALRGLDKPLVVVATQTIEAGVDVDFDGLVTEIAALDALRQRFGRLNRAGRPFLPIAAILAHKDDIGPKADDPVYGKRAAETWAQLQVLAQAAPDGTVDFGIDAFRELLKPVRAAEFAAPTLDAPVLLPAYAELWSHTSPVPNADPEVGLFLHGPDRSPAGVQLVWRADIAEGDLRPDGRDRLLELMNLMPPRAAETVEVPLWTVRAWLRRPGEPPPDFSDAAERAAEEDERGSRRHALRYAGSDSRDSRVVHPGEIRPGDLIVVPSEYGGCDEWGWNPASTNPVPDVAETAALPFAARRFSVRVTAALIQRRAAETLTADASPDYATAAASLPAVLAEHEEQRAEQILDSVFDELEVPQSLRVDLEKLRRRKRRLERAYPYGLNEEEQPRGIVFIAPFGLSGAAADTGEAAVPSTESDELGSATGYAQPLDEHSEEVRKCADTFAQRAGLLPQVAADVALAAYLHDAGKADPRFQAYLAGGEPSGWDRRNVLAKSGRSSLPRDAWTRAGLPGDWRHEALSVRLAQLHSHFVEASDPALVLWLVGVHHGFGRPLFPHADPLDQRGREDVPRLPGMTECPLRPGHGPQSLGFEFEGRDWPQMFEDLKRRYGIWGLARLEAFVRLADHRASEVASRRYAEQPAAQVRR